MSSATSNAELFKIALLKLEARVQLLENWVLLEKAAASDR